MERRTRKTRLKVSGIVVCLLLLASLHYWYHILTAAPLAHSRGSVGHAPYHTRIVHHSTQHLWGSEHLTTHHTPHHWFFLLPHTSYQHPTNTNTPLLFIYWSTTHILPIQTHLYNSFIGMWDEHCSMATRVKTRPTEVPVQKRSKGHLEFKDVLNPPFWKSSSHRKEKIQKQTGSSTVNQKKGWMIENSRQTE